MVYVSARNISSTIDAAIGEHLWCKETDVQLLTDHVYDGKGVAMLIDAVDEVHDLTVIENIKQYVHNRHTRGGAQFLISSRADLYMIDRMKFDRYLILKGFTIEQGVDYLRRSLKNGKSLPSVKHPVLEYVQRHKQKLESVLSNPLKLHIFYTLTKRGLLLLGDETTFHTLDLFEPLEKFIIRREGGYVTETQADNFYRLCLFAYLEGIKELPGELLNRFQIVDSYYGFLEKKTRTDGNARDRSNYSFSHEVVFEYFASKFINKDQKALLLFICSTSFHNFQKMVFEVILRKYPQQNKLHQSYIRSILLFQFWPDESTKLGTIESTLDLRRQIRTLSPIKELMGLSKMPSKTHVHRADVIWKEINRIFDSEAETLREVGWCMAIKQPVYDCLSICTSEQKAEIIQQTIYKLIPCQYIEGQYG